MRCNFCKCFLDQLIVGFFVERKVFAVKWKYHRVHWLFYGCRSVECLLATVTFSSTMVFRTARRTSTPTAGRCALAAANRSPDAASRPCTANITQSTLSARSANASSTRARSRSRVTSRTVIHALSGCSADVGQWTLVVYITVIFPAIQFRIAQVQLCFSWWGRWAFPSLFFFSGVHQWECVEPNVDNSLQSDHFWSTSITLFMETYLISVLTSASSSIRAMCPNRGRTDYGRDN